MPIKITSKNFKDEVLKSDVPVLLDFWASWCGPCRMVSPILDELSNDVGDSAKIGKVNVDEERELAYTFNVSSIPTLIVIKDGKITDMSVGVKDKNSLRQMLGV